MLDESASNLVRPIEYARGYLRDIGQWAVEIDKPVVLEEFGKIQQVYHDKNLIPQRFPSRQLPQQRRGSISLREYSNHKEQGHIL
jgi:hypothetical protein